MLTAANYEAGTKNIVIDKKQVAEVFFILSSSLTGEILQKYVNYGGIAIFCDYSHYTSKALKDFLIKATTAAMFSLPLQRKRPLTHLLDNPLLIGHPAGIFLESIIAGCTQQSKGWLGHF